MFQDFNFDGKFAKDFNLYPVNINNTNDSTSIVSSNTVNNFQSPNYDHDIWTSVQKGEALTTSIECIKMVDCNIVDITDYDIEQYARWFCREDGYYKLFFMYPNNDGIYYNAKINLSKVLINNKTIGVKFDIVTDSQFAWKHIEMNFDCEKDNEIKIYDYSSALGNKPINLKLICKEDGDYIFKHIFNGKEKLTNIKNCKSEEIINLTELQVITSSDNSHDIADDFNYIYPCICNNIHNEANIYSINKDCKIKISYEQKRKVGIL